MKVKICGITKNSETEYLNQVKADYAGFVFYEKSKRNLSKEQALNLFTTLDKSIKKVAVTVSPDVSMAVSLCGMEFDVLQVHKELRDEVINAVTIPIWYAVNISEASEIEKAETFINSLSKEQAEKIKGIVVDAKNFGSGVTFDWQASLLLKEKYSALFAGRDFILAGGLRPENVREGIEFFAPDIVDVSSGVEGEDGKSFDLIKQFVENAKLKGGE